MRDLKLLKGEAILGLQDPWYLSTEILGNGKDDKFPRPEREIRPVLEFLTRPRPADLQPIEKWFDYVSCPRETAKTVNTLVAITDAIIRDPNVCVMIMNEEKQQANASLQMVARWLELPKVTQLYGTFRGPTGWEKEFFYVSQRTRATRDPTVYTQGVQGPLEGWHPDIIVWDDLVGEQTANREGFLRAERRIEQSIPVLKTGGRGIYICTRWGLEDPSAGILKKWKAGEMWHALGHRGFFGAYAIPGDEKTFAHAVPGSPLFSSILSKEVLEKLQRGGMRWSLFSSQYLNEPAPEGGAYIEESDIQRFDLYVPA